MNPMIENVTNPPKILVNMSPVATTIVSLMITTEICFNNLTKKFSPIIICNHNQDSQAVPMVGDAIINQYYTEYTIDSEIPRYLYTRPLQNNM